MERIYHSYDKWEDHAHGFYDNVSGKNKPELIQAVVNLFSSDPQTRYFMKRVIDEWKYSCEHNLSNISMNRIAWLGQSACCLSNGVPSTVTMEAWSEVPLPFRERADKIANDLIQEWEERYAEN